MNNNNRNCLSCGEPLFGKYCHVCGEKKLSKEDFTVRKFFTQSIDVITHFDSKILKSVYLLVRRPGFLASEYMEGRRIKYAKPIQIFFVINIIYFFVLNYIGFDIFTDPLKDQTENFIYGNFASSMVQHKLADKNISFEAYNYTFYNTIYVHSKLLIIIMIPMLAGFCMLIFYRQKRLFYEHLVFSTYFFSFVLIFFTFFLNTLDYGIYFILKMFTDIDLEMVFDENYSTIFVIIIYSLYLFFAVRRVYGGRTWSISLKVFLIICSLFIISIIYGFILFLTVYYST